jgi:hypothetical protein
MHSIRCYIQVLVRTEQGGSKIFEVSPSRCLVDGAQTVYKMYDCTAILA